MLEDLLTEEARRRRLANLRPRARRPRSQCDATTAAECRNSDDRRRGRRKGPSDPQPRGAGPGDGPMRRSPSGSGSGARTCTGRPGRSGGWPDGRRRAQTAWPSSTPAPRRSTRPTRTSAAATASRPTSARRPTTSGRSATTGPSASPTPGSIPPAIVAHALHYFTPPGGLVVDPMAGGGTTLDVCQSMGRRCLAYDLEPSRPEIIRHDIRRVPPRGRRLRPHLLRPPLPHHAGPRVRRDGVASAPLHGVDRLPPRAGPRRARHPAPRGLPGTAPGHPDREGPARRLRLPRSRLFRLYRRAAGRLPARASDQLPDGRGLPAPARPPCPDRGTDARAGPRPARGPQALAFRETRSRHRSPIPQDRIRQDSPHLAEATRENARPET